MRRVLVEDLSGEVAVIEGGRLHHLARVLRVVEGEEIEVFDGKGGCRIGVVEALDPGEARIRLGPWQERPRLPTITLAQALSRPERFELVVQKATELGVSRIVPLALHRCVVRLDHAKGAKRAERWRRIAEEAARQSERADVPEIDEPLSLDAFLAGAKEREETIGVLWEEAAEGPRLGAWIEEQVGAPLALIIGPEGGITAEEVALARDAGAVTLGMGQQILRTETAGIVAIAIAMHRLGAVG